MTGEAANPGFEPGMATGSKMELVQSAPAEMPGVEEIARAIASFRKHITPADTWDPDILPSEMAQASAVAALFAPILAEKESLRRELHSLAVALHRKHYWHVKQWKPFDDALGLATQIDNMTAGLVTEARALAAEANFKTVAQENQDLIDKLEAAETALAAERAESEQLQATIRKAHVAMTLACALPGVASEYDFSEAIASTEAALARRAASIRAQGE